MEYFVLTRPESRTLWAEDAVNPFRVVSRCPIADHRTAQRIQTVIEVKHSKRDQMMIWLHIGPVVLHAKLLKDLADNGITGYRTRPATVYFRDGSVSNEYSELVVAGWGGVARPESGIRLIEKCPACGQRRYSSLENSAELIDWNQWSGEDFFMVWPLVGHILITKRVVDLLVALKIKSYGIGSLQEDEKENLPARWHDKIRVGGLSNFLPDDVAAKYGEPLGLM
jgi:hypothetical protein